jgi:ADP-ribosyl-[dinitrogen reductase] hydrolase
MAIETTGCFSSSSVFSHLLSGFISQIDEEYIQSSGYVLHTLEAAIWCALNASSYKDGVLRAVNLGEDTDTTSCVCGGLLGAYYGRKGIPTEWIQDLARLDDIETLLSKV